MQDQLAKSDIFRIRQMQSADFEHFLQLGCETCGSLHSRKNQTKSDIMERFRVFVKEFAFRSESEIWVAETNNAVYSGHLWLYVTSNRFNGNRELWVWDVSVMPELRGHGLGKILMQHAQKRAIALGCTELWLLVAEDNQIAQSLYASCGLNPRARMLAVEL